MVPLTPAVRNIIYICVAVFVADLLISSIPINNMLAVWKFSNPQFKPYQLFTYMFAHGSFLHILFNMLMLAMVGSLLEMVWGAQRFMIFYVVCGIGAALVWLSVEYFILPGGRDSYGLMLGASGAIYGLLAAYGSLYPEREMVFFPIPVPIKGKYLVVVLGLLTYVMDSGGTVAHMAHLGGALVGVLLVMFGRF